MKFFRNWGQPPFLKDIAEVFSRRVRSFGETPAGVLWKNSEGQQLRFEILAGILGDIQKPQPVSICDFGCGYGAMFDFLSDWSALSQMTYTGYDISEEMIHAAWQRIHDPRATFTEATKIDQAADFTFVSGTYNLKLLVDDEPWNAYVKSSLKALWPMTNKGLAFNMLDIRHPDQGEGLYYADASDFMDFCSELSDNIALVDDYPLQEWTIFVRRD
ncbi:MAG: class I SAM-dependent methyltransferase [Rhodospirillaceae bacterium]|jgi:SAM-dependent methyltransferase|nr:class I SAM-dependent methyltransferase [Rhodospirillaceae bacterium]MBT5244857.1 class I SAM-dependent methyltransferase [Rhodospirillaceae bacterium]MBT5562233.1 class I SAM-dependent methyltransferase [Rhodospirillaceae bacterium]MBT6242406.1 class I SAM-dependent methyltransferase [Rhodospirillaceae bacterium]MBT7138901.1 class I SAM-dependent methyltransferase [Rhodospirillaceae bacterium]